jgi:uncharacterized protein (DUF885 family)
MEPKTASVQLAEIISEEWESRLQYDPTFATYTGDRRFNDRLQSVAEDDYGQWLDHLRGLCRRLSAIDRSALTITEQLNVDILTRLLDNEVRDLEFHAYRLPISKAGGFHLDFSESLPLIAPFETVEDYEDYVARLAAFRRYVEEQIGVMRVGLATGYRPAAATLAGVDDALRKQIVADPASSPLYAPFARFPESIGGADRERLSAAGQTALLSSVVPGYEALLRFLNDEYVPGARDEVGACHLPNGREFYQHRIRYFTSLDLSAEQVHDTGQSEVKRIRAEMEDSIRAAGFQGGFHAFVEYLRTDPRFYAATPDALLKETAYVLKRIDGELPRLFKTLPRTPYGIRTIPDASAPGNTTAYYFPATGDGRCAGFYYVNTYDLKSRPLYEIEALSLHEAVPGHHLQITLQQELDLPPFRRFYGFTEFVEGWALYAERLGLEMGFYQDPYSDFGRLSYEMWRACRLVVDTGLHALGWSRKQAIDFMAANTSSTLLNIANEVDRYIAWPGQALAYKIGELKIRELRARAEQKLGSRFDLREFHDLVLGSGAVPLDVLDRMVDRWVCVAQRGNA